MGAPALDCPSFEDLERLRDGLLDEPRLSATASHLDSCPDCRDRMERCATASSDPILAVSPHFEFDRYFEEAECREIVRRLANWTGTPRSWEGSIASTPRLSAAAPLLQRVGQYQILELLGEGGMGAVHKALHLDLEKIVALKMVAPRLAGHTEIARRFKQEMKSIGRLQHRNIVNAFDGGESKGVYFLAMEYLEGIDLAALIRRAGRLPTADACELARQAACGLDYVARQGLVHRDVKPSNLMLTRDGEGTPIVKILDLGLALLRESPPPDDSNHGSSRILGTLDYIAPEQAADSGNVDFRADIYSLGATLHHLLAGAPPFAHSRGDGPSPRLASRLDEPTPSLRERCPQLPAELIELVDQMLDRDPSRRPASAMAAAQRLAPFRNGHDLNKLLRDNVRDDFATLDAASAASTTVAGAKTRPLPPRFLSLSVARRPASRRKRWRRRFRAIALAVLMFVASLSALSIYEVCKTVTNRPPDSSPPSGDFERAAAQWILDHKGRATVCWSDHDNDRVVHFRYGDALPKQTSKLTAAQIWVDNHRMPEMIRMLKPCRYLGYLTLEALPFSEPPSRAAMEGLASLPHLQGLDFLKMRLRVEDLDFLPNLSQLHHLNFDDVQLGDELGAIAASCPRLTSLVINQCPVSDRVAEPLTKGLTLRQFDVNSELITDNIIDNLRDFPNFESLHLRSIQLTDGLWGRVAQLQELRALGIENNRRLKGRGIAALVKLKLLTQLQLRHLAIPNDALKDLAKLPRLIVLDLEDNPITDDGLVYLHDTSLSQLRLVGTQVTKAGVEKLRAALPNCSIIWDEFSSESPSLRFQPMD